MRAGLNNILEMARGARRAFAGVSLCGHAGSVIEAVIASPDYQERTL